MNWYTEVDKNENTTHLASAAWISFGKKNKE